MQLSPNQQLLPYFFSAFLESTSNFQYFGTKSEPQRQFVSEIIEWKKRGYLKA